MMFSKSPYLLLMWFILKVNFITAQNQEICETPDHKQGTCININSCQSLSNLLMTQSNNTQIRNFLRASACGFEGTTPKVCCPQDRTSTQNSSGTKLPKIPNCGFSNVTVPRIVNGVPAKLGEFPWIVALGYRNLKNSNQPKWLCGGTLITNKHILTAAHCVYQRSDLYIARLGDLDLYSDDDGASPVTISLAKAKIHENYNGTVFVNDIAILTLKEAPNNPTIWPICLPLDEPLRSMTYLNFSPLLAGWGSVSFNGPSSPALQEIFVTVVDNQACARVFSRRAIIDNNIICAGSTNGDKDACGGDSGGPLMHEVSEGDNYRAYQIGIVSYGFRCAEPGYPGVYTRVTAFMEWIENNLD